MYDQNVYRNANPCACQKHGIVMILYKLFTWHCCDSSQAAGCRSWFVGVNLHSDSVPHNTWSVVCKVDFKRIRGGWGCDHWGRGCAYGCVRCSGTCQEKVTYTVIVPHSQLTLAICDRLSINHPFTTNINNTVRATISPT